MSEKEAPDQETEQTAFQTAGIPTPPPDQKDIAATDMLSDVVEVITDKVEHAMFPDANNTKKKE